MRKCFISTSLLMLVNCAAYAEGFNFTVEGVIKSATCNATILPRKLIKLPIISQRSLAQAGDRSGKTKFSISLNKCPAKSSIYFDKSQATITKGGRLSNTTASNAGVGASNVELELLNANGESVNLAASSGSQKIPEPIASGSETAVFNLYVQYYATGLSTVGKVTSSVTFIIESP